MYYEPGSLKAGLCVEGRHLLYDYCQAHGIPYRRCGKLIVATSAEQLGKLGQIEQTARSNGVTDLYWVEAGAASRLEPQLSCVAALCSPSTGIIDSHSYMLVLLAEAEAAGALIACGIRVDSLRPTPAGIEISIADEARPVVRARLVVNSAGLHATSARGLDFRISRRIHTAADARQGELLLPHRPLSLSTPDISGAGTGRASAFI